MQIGRRQFLAGSLSLGALLALKKAFGIGFAFANEEAFLLWQVKQGDNLTLLARYFTGRDSNYKILADINNKNTIKVGEKIKIPIFHPTTNKLFITPALNACLRLEPADFEVWTIESGENQNSIASIMENFLNYKAWGYNGTLGALLFLNHINLRGIIFDDENLRVPTLLVRPDILRDRPPKLGIWDRFLFRISGGKVQAQLPANLKYQNPFREDSHKALSVLRDKDLFRARRIRTINGIDYIKPQGHDGLDLACSIGTPLYPIDQGKVVFIARYAKPDKKWREGNVIEYSTPEGFLIRYCHLLEIKVTMGQEITRTTLLGFSGITGNASPNEPHVHIEIRKQREELDPALLIFQQRLIPKMQT